MDIIMVGIAGMIAGAIFVLNGPAIGLAGSAQSSLHSSSMPRLRCSPQWHMQNK
jgi:cobalamin biosynthesis Mg chelatase CobN